MTIIITPEGERLVSVPGYIPKDKLLRNLELTLKFLREEYKPAVKEEKREKKEERIVLPDRRGLERYLKGFEDMATLGYDPVFGGFGLGTKEVFGEELLLIAELYRIQGDEKWLKMLTNTLDHMAGWKQKRVERKRPSFEELVRLRENEWERLEEVDRLQIEDKIVGIYDPVEGGFFRYATRRDWTVPHYEKMLFENAQLIALFLKAYEITKDRKYRKVAEKTLDFVLKNLYIADEKRFSGSMNADEVYYHFTAEERKKVKPPIIDRTSYTVPTARMILTLLYASEVLGDERYKRVALDAISFFEEKMITENGVFSYYDDKKKRGLLDGNLVDNAWFALALLAAYEGTGDRRYLRIAEESVIGFALRRLYDPKGGGFFERRSTSRDLYREGELFSDDKPYKENGVMAYALLKAYRLTGKEEYLKRAEETMGRFLAKFMTGELDRVSPYFYRVAYTLLRSKGAEG